MKLLFIPLSVIGGFIAGMIGSKLFERIWAVIDDQEPPDAEHRDVHYGKLALALALDGAIFRVVRGFADHGVRQGYLRLTGSWPGEEEPEGA